MSIKNKPLCLSINIFTLSSNKTPLNTVTEVEVSHRQAIEREKRQTSNE